MSLTLTGSGIGGGVVEKVQRVSVGDRIEINCQVTGKVAYLE